MHIDVADRALLCQLQRDSTRSMQELAESVGLSASSCHRRIKALEAEGLISGYRAVLDAQKLGFSMLFFIEISLNSQSEKTLDAFEAAVRDAPEVQECFLMAGQSDYLLRVACRDQEDFERVHRRLLSRLPGVSRVLSNMSIRTVKSDSGLSI
jgi:Lrp/AsnC family transcriptional regulator, leucine-responsive regulatory protein